MSGPVVETVTLPDGAGPDLRSRARDALLAGLTTGSLSAGVLYSVPLLAGQLGMSATPVREAMLDLARDGLVEPVRNRGFRVRPISDTELDEICEIREFLEVPATTTAAAALTPADLERLDTLAHDIHRHAVAQDMPRYLSADREFHLLLLSRSGNAELVQLVDRLRNRTRLYNLQNLARSGDLTPSADEHREMVALIRAGRVTALTDLMRQHIRHTRSTWATPERSRPDHTVAELGAAPHRRRSGRTDRPSSPSP
jgi:DNA-binding GntR family transcriptional regulator